MTTTAAGDGVRGQMDGRDDGHGNRRNFAVVGATEATAVASVRLRMMREERTATSVAAVAATPVTQERIHSARSPRVYLGYYLRGRRRRLTRGRGRAGGRLTDRRSDGRTSGGAGTTTAETPDRPTDRPTERRAGWRQDGGQQRPVPV